MKQLTNANAVSLNFNLREPNAKHITNVYAVVRIGSKQTKLSMGCYVNPWNWDNKRQMPKVNNLMVDNEKTNNLQVANIINCVRFGVMKKMCYFCNSVSESDVIAEIKKIINHQIPQEKEMNHTEQKREYAYKASTLLNKAYNVLYSDNKTALGTKKDVLQKLNLYVDYCQNVKKNDTKKMLTSAALEEYKLYLLKNTNNTKRVINQKCEKIEMLINKVIAINPLFSRYKVEKVKYYKIANEIIKAEDKKKRELTPEQVQKIEKCENLNGEETIIKDAFLLLCYTGLRISDLNLLFDESRQKTLENEKGEKFIQVIPKKEEKKRIKAIFKYNDVKDIISKYPNGISVSEQKFNKIIKVIAEKAKLNEMCEYIDKGISKVNSMHKIISSHWGRYTFIYKALFVWKMPKETLIIYTGHTSTQMINEVYNRHEQKMREQNAINFNASTIENSNQASKTESDKVKEYKDVLAFYGEPYINYKNITDSEELLRMIIKKYEIPLKEKGYEIKVLKKIYNSKDVESTKHYENLLKTLNIISESINKPMN